MHCFSVLIKALEFCLCLFSIHVCASCIAVTL
uniref:Uncharacterized protein n=1 Tax=Rhizophora mucronata TaxID=61149 RepID=A0A2P2Q093_RHIMU